MKTHDYIHHYRGYWRPGGVWDDMHFTRPPELNDERWHEAPVIDAPGRTAAPAP